MFYVVVNEDTIFNFENFEGANNFFLSLKNFPGGSPPKVCLYKEGALINKNY